MKWFKHFSDNHRGRSIMHAVDKLGHSAWAIYTIMEICAEKLDKKVDRELNETDCVFSFHRTHLQNVLRMKQAGVRNVLETYQESGWLRFASDENEIRIEMPILLDLLEYDQKKSRQRRAEIAPGSRLEKKQKQKQNHNVQIAKVDEPKANQFIATYCQLFKQRYKTNPIIDGKAAGIAKRLSLTLGENRFQKILEAFFQMPDAELVKSKHPLAKLEFKLNEVTVFADSGTFTPKAQADHVDRKQAESLNKKTDYEAIKARFLANEPKQIEGNEGNEK